LSRSFFSLPLLLAVTMSFSFPGLFSPFFVIFRGTMTSVTGPHAVPLKSGGRASLVPLGMLLTVIFVSGGCGVHAGTLGSVWFGQSATLKTQTSFGRPSVSQASLPSVHGTTFAPTSAPVTSSSM